ncbi:MAG: hypothetical protein QMC85_05455 [Methanocellales archaeon]|nr:hypothetical protein [Methanocellales archaeon]
MEHIMKLNQMREKVKEELNHIPRWDFNQNMLRQAYWSLRLHSLGKKSEKEKTKEEVLIEVTELIKKDNPSFYPRFDEKFFDLRLLREVTKNKPNIQECFFGSRR